MADLSYLTIEHAPNKTTYLVGDKFEKYGMIVKAHYDDNTSANNVGSHSMHQVYKSGLTKVWKYGFKMSYKVMAKGFAYNYITSYGEYLYYLLHRLINS